MLKLKSPAAFILPENFKYEGTQSIQIVKKQSLTYASVVVWKKMAKGVSLLGGAALK